MYLPKYAVGEFKHPFKIGMRLSSDHFVDTSSFETAKGRAFTIYRWQNDLELNGQKYSGYIPWLHWSKKWERFKSMTHPMPDRSINGKPLLPMHQHFKDLDDFKAWLGDVGFQDLLVALL